MILDDVGVTKKIWSDYILVTFWLHIMVYGYTESDVIAESRGWNEMSGDNDVVCVLWICVVVGTESYVCDQLPKLPEEPPPIGDCAGFEWHSDYKQPKEVSPTTSRVRTHFLVVIVPSVGCGFPPIRSRLNGILKWWKASRRIA